MFIKFSIHAVKTDMKNITLDLFIITNSALNKTSRIVKRKDCKREIQN